MYAIAPQTDVYLLKVPLEINDINQLTFANATAQYNYFSSLPRKAYDEFTYQRKDGVIRIPEVYDDILTYNYVMYRNDAYGDKWFYAFIEDMTYVNDAVTMVKIKTDVWQTWQFDLNYKRTFVEREHVNDDTIGLHTVPENLDVGEYVINDMRKIPMYQSGTTDPDFMVCFVVSKLAYNNAPWFSSSFDNVGGVFSSLYMFAVKSFEDAKGIFTIYEKRGTSTEAIQNMYMIPSCCVDATNVTWYPEIGDGTTIYAIKQAGWTSDMFTLEEPATLNGYQPKNNKLYTAPYSYFYIDNNAGISAEYAWEDFPNQSTDTWTTPHPIVNYYKAMIPSTSVSAKLFFDNYKKYQTAQGARTFNYGVNFGKIPVCAWTTDYYTNWLTQNGVNVAVNTASNLLNTGLGMATMNPVGMASGAIGLASTIGNTVGELHQASKVPPQAHGDLNCGDFIFAYDRCSMNFYMMSVRSEYARICDNYMSMFGYKVNTVKVPNITGRRNWNYVKTVGCYIDADIPQRDLEEIKLMFDKGITLWHNPATFADYSQNNDII